MKHLFWLLFYCPLMIYGQINNRGVNFETNMTWEQVKAKAKAEHKYIFVDCYATWCSPCKRMDKEVYTEDTVGEYMKEKFICIKVQLDTSQNDNEQIKGWYASAHEIYGKYKVGALPTYLFIDSSGNLAYRDFGYKNVPDFIQTLKKALNPKNLIYYGFLEDYKNGKKDYKGMYDLAIYTKNIGNDSLAKQISIDLIKHLSREELLTKENILLVCDVAGDKKLSDFLALEYKKKYLDLLNDSELCTKENLYFSGRFNYLINSKDNLFILSYFQAERVDRVINFKGWANSLVEAIIYREELINRIWKDGKLINRIPQWDFMRSEIEKKYKKVDAIGMVLNCKISYYRKLRDWRKWAICQSKKIEKYSLKSGDGFWKLNLPAWDVFLHCNDKKVLKMALKWSDLSIKIDEPNSNPQCLDTRANLLYKLGNRKDAMFQEEKAIEIAEGSAKKLGKQKSPFFDAYTQILIKMRKREPTYLEEGAIWDAKTLPGLK